MTTSYILVLTTLPEEAQASTLAKAIVSAQLGGCVQIDPVQSVYAWQGEVCEDVEYRLVVKTHIRHYPALEAFIKERHPYDVPQIIQVPMTAGYSAYFAWLDENLAAR